MYAKVRISSKTGPCKKFFSLCIHTSLKPRIYNTTKQITQTLFNKTRVYLWFYNTNAVDAFDGMALPEWAKHGPPGIAMNGVSAQATEAKDKDVTRYPMDMTTAKQYWAFYHGGIEPTLDACRKLRHDNTFHGPIEVLWGMGDTDPIRLDGPGEEDMLKDLFRQALEWRDVFGMVPMYLRRRAKRHHGRPLVVIPPFGSGNFFLEYNKRDFSTKMVYHVSRHELSGSSSLTTKETTSTKSSKKKEPFPVTKREILNATSQTRRPTHRTLDVYVWHGSMPDIALLQFQSTIQALLPKYSEIAELRRNLLVADRGNAFPTVFTETSPDKRGVAEQTEEELFGQVGDPGILPPGERAQYLRNTHRALRQEQLTASQNAAARDLPVARYDAGSRRLQSGAVSKWNGTVEQLSAGESLARAINPSSRSDINQFEERFAEQLCTAMGIPYGYIRGSGGSRIRGETEQMKEVFRAAIARDRQDVNSFYAFAHELMHRSKDDQFLTQALIQADDQTTAAMSPEEIARQHEIRTHIEQIAEMPQRVRVVFVEDPIPRTLDLRVLEAASNTGSISIEEQANLLRQELGLPPLDSESPLLRGVDATEAPVLNGASVQGTGSAAGLSTQARQISASSSSSSAAAAAAAAAATSRDTPSSSVTKEPVPGSNRKRTTTNIKEGKQEVDDDADDEKEKEKTGSSTGRSSKRRRT